MRCSRVGHQRTGGEYSVDGGAYTSADGSVANGQSVRVRHTATATIEVSGGAWGGELGYAACSVPDLAAFPVAVVAPSHGALQASGRCRLRDHVAVGATGQRVGSGLRKATARYCARRRFP